MASEEVKGSFCRYDSCVITDQLATDAGALERELLVISDPLFVSSIPTLFKEVVSYDLQRLAAEQPQWRERSAEFRRRFLAPAAGS